MFRVSISPNLVSWLRRVQKLSHVKFFFIVDKSKDKGEVVKSLWFSTYYTLSRLVSRLLLHFSIYWKSVKVLSLPYYGDLKTLSCDLSKIWSRFKSQRRSGSELNNRMWCVSDSPSLSPKVQEFSESFRSKELLWKRRFCIFYFLKNG